MTHVVTRPNQPFKSRSGRLTIHQVPAWQDNLVWLIEYNSSGDVAVVDGPDAENVLAYCEKMGLTVRTILNTHTHPDHIGINLDMDKRGLLSSLRVVGCEDRADDVPGINERVKGGDSILLGEVSGEVISSEGHINGHIAFLFEDVLFSGDALFAGGCGYLFDGPPEKMHATLDRFGGLDPSTRVCCAHEYTQDNLTFAWSVEPDNQELAARIRRVWKVRAEGGSAVPSTIGEELETNPFMRTHSVELRRRVRVHMADVDFESGADIFGATRGLKDKKLYKQSLPEPLPISE